MTPSNIFLQMIVKPITKGTRIEFFYLIPLSQTLILYLFTGSWAISFKLWLTIHIAFSIYFSKMTFFGHRTGYEWTAGN